MLCQMAWSKTPQSIHQFGIMTLPCSRSKQVSKKLFLLKKEVDQNLMYDNFTGSNYYLLSYEVFSLLFLESIVSSSRYMQSISLVRQKESENNGIKRQKCFRSHCSFQSPLSSGDTAELVS